MIVTHTINSPVGALTLAGRDAHLTGLWLEGQKHFASTLDDKNNKKGYLPLFQAVEDWLDIYFSGKDPGAPPPLLPAGTPFQQAVWQILCQIPYGETCTYSDIATHLAQDTENPRRTSARAVGSAVARNPISILIPCHRVVGKNRQLVGYAGGLAVKQQLLQLEAGAWPLPADKHSK